MESDTDKRLEADEFEVDGTDDEDLEAAMREALEAVEAAQDGVEGASGEDDRAPESAAEPGLEEAGFEELTILRREVAELRDRSVRTLADFDNFRKRAERERDEQRRYAGSEVLRDFLPVIDNLERALESSGESDELKAGVELILRQILDLLRRHGVKRVQAINQPFDPGVHEAVSRREVEGLSGPVVCEELQAGYVMKDRLLRPSMVVVSVPVTVSPALDDEGSD